MLPVTLIGFSNDAADRIAADLAADGLKVSRTLDTSALSPDVAAAFICADRDGWEADLRKIRAVYPRLILIAVTRLPEYTIWLDALEAGANDYACMPLDRQQLQWLFRRPPQTESRGSTRSARAS